jgi:hypothetical protein
VENFKALRISESTTQDYAVKPFGCSSEFSSTPATEAKPPEE